jgi:hypothetical protein
MDYTYVHKKVPYPLTVEVFGGGNIGKLGPGESSYRTGSTLYCLSAPERWGGRGASKQ